MLTFTLPKDDRLLFLLMHVLKGRAAKSVVFRFGDSKIGI